MEGIMMMNRDKYAVAVRKPNREIEVRCYQLCGFTGYGIEMPDVFCDFL